ncbi:MAG TPA: multidrug effflux MFS transporter [Baekduia sp.]|nr:multidrug effflux MFS transporter [Baekduia sp.]
MRRRVALLTVLGALSAFGPLSIDLYLPSLPSIGDDLDASASSIQLSITACLVGLAVGQIYAGPLSDRLGRRRVLAAGLVAFVAASALCAAAPSAAVLIGLRLVQGLAGSFGIVISRAIVRDLHEGDEMNRVFSRLMLVSGVAPVVAPLLGAQLLHVMGWRGLFVVLTAVGAAIALAAAVIIPETLPPERRRALADAGHERSPFAAIARDRRFIACAIVGGGVSGVLFAYISASPFVVEDIHGASPQVFSVVFAVNSVAIVLAGQLNGRLLGRVRSETMLRAAVATCAAGAAWCLLAAILALPLAALLPGWLLAIAPMGVVMPNGTTLALAGYGHAAGAAAAVLGTSQFLVGALASPLVGVAGSGTAVPMAIVMTAFAAAAVAAAASIRPQPACSTCARVAPAASAQPFEAA